MYDVLLYPGQVSQWAILTLLPCDQWSSFSSKAWSNKYPLACSICFAFKCMNWSLRWPVELSELGFLAFCFKAKLELLDDQDCHANHQANVYLVLLLYWFYFQNNYTNVRKLIFLFCDSQTLVYTDHRP